MTYKMIQVGTGGFGTKWCKEFLPVNIKDGLIEVVAAVDKNPEALKNAQKYLGVPEEKCYTNIEQAFDENKADFCTIVVPPSYHENVVDLALSYDMDILSEKPIADTLEASVRIVNKIREANKKMGITMSHRFSQDKTTLRNEIKSNKYGELDYLICRFTCNCRKYASWGKFRHDISDPLMIEGAVHHLDILEDLAGARCETIYAQTWNPPWGEYKGDSQALVQMNFKNGKHAFYEGAKTNSIGLNCWGNEYIRAECEKATLILNHRSIQRFKYKPGRPWGRKPEEYGENINLYKQRKWSHAWLIEKFIEWLNGGDTMETNVEDNLKSLAMVFAAIESSHKGEPINVKKYLDSVS